MPTVYGVPFRQVLSTLSLGEPTSVANDGGFLYQNLGINLSPIASEVLDTLTFRPRRIFVRTASNSGVGFTDAFDANGFMRLTGPGSVGVVNVPLSVIDGQGRWRYAGGIDGWDDWIARFNALTAGNRSLQVDFFDTGIELELGLDHEVFAVVGVPTPIGLDLGVEKPVGYTGTPRIGVFSDYQILTQSISTTQSFFSPGVSVYNAGSGGGFSFSSLSYVFALQTFSIVGFSAPQSWADDGDVVVSSTNNSAVLPAKGRSGDQVYSAADHPSAASLFFDILGGQPVTLEFRTYTGTTNELGLELGVGRPTGELGVIEVEAGNLGLELGLGTPNAFVKRAAGELGLELGVGEPDGELVSVAAGELGLELGVGEPTSRIGSIAAGELGFVLDIEERPRTISSDLEPLVLELGLGTPNAYRKIAAGELGLELGFGPLEFDIVGVPTQALELELGLPTKPVGYTGTVREADFGSSAEETQFVITPSVDDSDLSGDVASFYIDYNGIDVDGFSASLYSLYLDSISFDIFFNTYPDAWGDSPVSATIRNAHGDEVTQTVFDSEDVILFSEDTTPGYTAFFTNLFNGNDYDLTVTLVYGMGSGANELELVFYSPPVNHQTRVGVPDQPLVLELGTTSPVGNLLSVVAGDLGLELGVGAPESRIANVVAGDLGLDLGVSEPVGTITSVAAGELRLELGTGRPSSLLGTDAGELRLELGVSEPESRLTSVGAGELRLELGVSSPSSRIGSVFAGELGLELGVSRVNAYRKVEAGTLALELGVSRVNAYRKVEAGTLALELGVSSPTSRIGSIVAGELRLELGVSRVSTYVGRGAGELELRLDVSNPIGTITSVGAGELGLELGVSRVNAYRKVEAGTLALELGVSSPSSRIGSVIAGELGLELGVSRVNAYRKVEAGTLALELGVSSPTSRIGSIAAGELRLDLGILAPTSRIGSIAAGELRLDLGVSKVNGFVKRSAGTLGLVFGSSPPEPRLGSLRPAHDLELTLDVSSPIGTITSVAAGELELVFSGRVTNDVGAGELVLNLSVSKPIGTITSTAGGELKLVFVTDTVSGIRKITAGELQLVLEGGKPLVIRGMDPEPAVQRTQRSVRDSIFNRNFSAGVINVPYNER